MRTKASAVTSAMASKRPSTVSGTAASRYQAGSRPSTIKVESKPRAASPEGMPSKRFSKEKAMLCETIRA